MARDAQIPDPPRWARLLCYGLVAAIVFGLAFRTLADAMSIREAVRGLSGIAVLCLWLGYAYVSKTRWRDRYARDGLALLACLAITAAALSLLTPAGERWLDPELAITFTVGLLFALALVLSRYVSLSRRAFGVFVPTAGVGIVGLGLAGYGAGALGWLETIVTGGFCLIIGLLYVCRPAAMARLESRYQVTADSPNS
ncbi:hypothetical protein [Halopiger thermotolerans]